MKLTQKGQVTIPLRLRKRYGLHPYTDVVFEEAKGGVLLKVAPGERRARLERLVARARGQADAGMTTDQIMKMTRD